jgi:signal transduction histidine kinase
MRAEAKTLFNGANSPASLVQVQNSHPMLLARGNIMRLSCGRRTPHLAPLNEPGVRRRIFSRAKITAFLQQGSIIAQADVNIVRSRFQDGRRMKLGRYTLLAALNSFFVQLPNLIRTTTFRWTAGAFAVCIVLFSGFVYWEAADYMLAKTDAALTEECLAIAGDSPDRQLNAIDDRLSQDPRHIKLAGLFGPDGHRIAGNLESLPPGLKIDAPVQSAAAIRIDQKGAEKMTVRAIARSLPNGNLLVIAGNIDELTQLAEVVARALLLGLPLALGLSLVIGMVLSVRAQRRVDEFNTLVRSIVAGDLRQRLLTGGLDHPFDKLAETANRMLDEIEALVQEMAGVGNEIAHDLRTPLTRVRLALERGRANAETLEELRAVTDRAIGGVDQALTIITTLLRIAEIEYGSRLGGLENVALADLVREVGDLYEPIAEDKHITLRVVSREDATVRGDRGLLLEAVANLVDNALKFTPAGGYVELALVHGKNESIVRVTDSGPGIRENEREAVTRRFYRCDQSRTTFGFGLGLSLVSAIVKLHGFRLTIAAGPGCVAEIACALPSV